MAAPRFRRYDAASTVKVKAMKRSLSSALFSLLFGMGCNEPGGGMQPRISGQVKGTFLRCENSAPFITNLIIGKPTAQGYPVEIKGLACVNDGINVAVQGGGESNNSAAVAVAKAAAIPVVDPDEGSFDANF